MASLYDVLSVLCVLVTEAVYPNGTSQPSTGGVNTTIMCGWPIRNKIDSILKLNEALISIFPTNKTKVVTKFERIYQDLTHSDPTITASISENTVTIGGIVTVPQAIILVVNGINYSYQILDTDTTQTIAQSLSLLIPNSSVTGSTIILSNPYEVRALIVVNGTAGYELSRQERTFLIRLWTTSPDVRNNLMNPIDVLLKKNYRITLPDGFFGMVWPMESAQPFMDEWEKSLMLIGNLEYKVQYPTTQIDEFTVINQTIQNVVATNAIT